MSALTAAVLLAALSQMVPAAPAEPVELTGDLARYEAASEVTVLTGNAVARTSQWQVRADELRHDPRAGTLSARGHVLVVNGLLAGFADALEVELASNALLTEGGLFMQKRDVTEEVLRAARTREELELAGGTVLTVSGKRVVRRSANHFLVDGLSFTPCDCNPLKPSWRIQASHADIVPGERALLTWPVVYVYGVPVLISPWLYLPLSNRRTGLLVPRLSFVNGFSVDAPVFITLGESADVTVTPGYAFEGNPLVPGVQGPRLGSDWLYMPSETTHGRFTLNLLYDLRPARNPVDGLPLTPAAPRGMRWGGSWMHQMVLPYNAALRVDLAATSDAALPRELTSDVLSRETDYVRSTAVLSQRGEDHYAGLSFVALQDLGVVEQNGWAYPLFGRVEGLKENQLQAPATVQRLPGLLVSLPDRKLFGGLFGSVQAELVRTGPLGAETADLYVPATGWPVRRQGLEGRLRAGVMPRLSYALGLGSALRLTPYAAFRQNAWLGEREGDWLHRGYPLLGAIAESEVARVFPAGEGSSFRHAIAPSVEVRSVPFVLGRGPTAGPLTVESPLPLRYDEVDGAVPAGGFFQGAAALSQRLAQRTPAGVVERVRVDVRQTFDFGASTLADTSLRLMVFAGPLSAAASASYDWRGQTWDLLQGTVGLQFPKALARVSYTRLASAGSERTRRVLDALVGDAPPPPVLDAAGKPVSPGQQLTVEAGVQLPAGLSLGLGMLIVPPQMESPRALALAFRSQVLSLGFAPACNCWSLRAEGGMVVYERAENLVLEPTFRVVVDLGRFGSFGSGG